MKLWKKRLMALLIPLFMVFSLVQAPISSLAEEESEYYTINGYNKKNIIKDSSNKTVKGYAYCLDFKVTPPSGQQYLRTTLSEYDAYSDDVKSRLIKILVETKKFRSLPKTSKSVMN